MGSIDLFVDDTGRISRNPVYQWGAPCVRGQRISVSAITGRVQGGDSIEETAADYRIDVEDVEAALAYTPTPQRRASETKFMNRLVAEYYRSKEIIEAAEAGRLRAGEERSE